MNRILFLFSILLSSACGEGSSTHTDEHNADEHMVHLDSIQIRTAGIQTGPVSYTQISGAIQANGSLRVPPQNLLSITAPIGGYIRELNLLQGKMVQRGDVILVIESPEYIQLQQDYLEIAEKHKLATLERQRQEQLHSGQAGVEKLRQQAETNLNQLTIARNAMAEKLKLIGIPPVELKPEGINGRLQIRAKVNGFVKSVNANVGKYVSPQETIVELIDMDQLQLELSVFEKDADKIKPGQKVNFFRPGSEKSLGTAQVFLIGKALNEDHTLVVFAKLEQKIPEHIPGLFVNAIIETDSDSVYAVPEKAIAWVNGNPVLFAEQGKGNYRWIPVSVGTVSNGMVPVTLPKQEDLRSINIVLEGAHALAGALSGGTDVH